MFEISVFLSSLWGGDVATAWKEKLTLKRPFGTSLMCLTVTAPETSEFLSSNYSPGNADGNHSALTFKNTRWASCGSSLKC